MSLRAARFSMNSGEYSKSSVLCVCVCVCVCVCILEGRSRGVGEYIIRNLSPAQGSEHPSVSSHLVGN